VGPGSYVVKVQFAVTGFSVIQDFGRHAFELDDWHLTVERILR
jgi:hypothetical protein